MVVETVARDWSVRLAHLSRLLEADPAGPTWLWRIRFRILSYLVSRYGGQATDTPAPAGALDPGDVGDITDDDGRAVIVLGRTLLPPVGVEHPPRRGPVISPILLDLQTVNQQRRAAESHDLRPDIAWCWWRSNWCRRRP